MSVSFFVIKKRSWSLVRLSFCTLLEQFHIMKRCKPILYLELLAVHGGDFSFLADGEGVCEGFPRSFGCDGEVVAALLDFYYWFNILGHFYDIFWQSWRNKNTDSERPTITIISQEHCMHKWIVEVYDALGECNRDRFTETHRRLSGTPRSSPARKPATFRWRPCLLLIWPLWETQHNVRRTFISDQYLYPLWV